MERGIFTVKEEVLAFLWLPSMSGKMCSDPEIRLDFMLRLWFNKSNDSAIKIPLSNMILK